MVIVIITTISIIIIIIIVIIRIDNMTMMTVTLAATGHMYITNTFSNRISSFNSIAGQFMSGIIIIVTIVIIIIIIIIIGLLLFGGLALNTKITSLALLPFLLAYTSLIRYYAGTTATTTGSVITDITVHCFYVVLGSILSHLPWLCYYHHMTGYRYHRHHHHHHHYHK